MRQRIVTTGLAAIAAGAIMLGLGAEARAGNILFTVTGVINDTNADPTSLGYTNGQPVSFVWELNDYAPATPVGTLINSNYLAWRAEDAGDPVLWANFGGTGLTGTYSPSTGNNPNNYVEIIPPSSVFSPPNGLALRAGSDSGSIGLVTPNSTEVRQVAMLFSATLPFSFTFPETLQNPATYFADYLGSYSLSGGTNSRIEPMGGASVHWTPQTLTIAPVPEPSTWLLAAGGLGGAAWVAARRRTRRAGRSVRA